MPAPGSVELFVLGGTRDTTADRGITLKLVIAALVERRKLFTTVVEGWKTRGAVSDEPHRSTRDPKREKREARDSKNMNKLAKI